MPAENSPAQYSWFPSGAEFFAAQLREIDTANVSLCLEMYIFAPGPLGERFRSALVAARCRGVQVQVLLDALGSSNAGNEFWKPLRNAGGEVRHFNPLDLRRLVIRDHRKMLVCDDRIAFVGGFNVAPEYEGDGETRGWCDVGLAVTGDLVAELAAAFDHMFARADFRHKILSRFRKREATEPIGPATAQLLLGGPGRGVNPIARALHADLGHAREVQIMVAYFLPTRRLRADMLRAARRGGRVQLILAGRSDVPLSHLAGRSLYRRLLKAGVEIYEYQPQILHAKLFLIDLAIYAGSANLDTRSLQINYELMLRIQNPELAAGARAIFERRLALSHRITFEAWTASNSLWRRLKHRLAYFLLVQLDPFVAGRQWRRLSD